MNIYYETFVFIIRLFVNINHLYLVSLTQTSRKGRAGKEKLIEEIREAVEKYSYVYVFELRNSKNNFLKEVRETWNKRDSRFFL